ncbi:MAG: metallophosphoesterase [Puniceicoccales bacterium]|jgi:predicted phosphodiesterase|nr:metallophosphoesterase [Puniceicoccales bacterium]
MKKLILFCLLLGSLSANLTGRSDNTVRLVLMPDTQTYARAFPHVFYSQTEWISKNADNIDFVLHQGDITDGNSSKEWKVARKAMSQLDEKIPYSIVLGNHDKSPDFNKFFPYKKYSKKPGFGGAFEEGKMDNIWQTFNAGGHKWLVFSLEFLPQSKVLKWANEVAKQHPNHKIIVNTHAYMFSDNTRLKTGHPGIPKNLEKQTGDKARNNGEMMWKKFVSLHQDMMFVFSGHIIYNGGAGRLTSRGIHGNEVYQMLANYQSGTKGSKPDDGWLRIIDIDFTKKEIDVKTYSPRLDKYRTEKTQQFKLKINNTEKKTEATSGAVS